MRPKIMTPNHFVKKPLLFQEGGGGALAANFDLVAFLFFMIALVKETVNHLRILESMRKMPT